MSLWDRPNGPNSQAATVANSIPLNTQAALPGPLPAGLTLTGTSETVVPSTENAAVPLTVVLPPNTQNEQTALDLVATGIVTTKNSTNITINVYEGVSLTVGSDKLLGSSGTVAVNSKTVAWKAKLELLYDSVSGVLVGTIEFYLAEAIVAKVTLSNFPTGISNTGNPVATFLLSFTSSAADGSHATTVNVQKFSVG